MSLQILFSYYALIRSSTDLLDDIFSTLEDYRARVIY